MAVSGSSTSANGDSLLIGLSEPYENVVEVISFQDEVKGETTDLYFDKFFRWGIDGASYSDWVPLTDLNLKSLDLNPSNPFWIEYKYQQVGSGTLEFVSMALELVTDTGKICVVPQYDINDSNCLSGSQNLVINCVSEPWNPYDISRPAQAYKQMSAMVSDMFGFCVKYFKTKADQRSKDVILKEYSLFDVIQSDEVKIMVPDNELPTRAIQFNPMMMDFPVQFEIHIVKSAFQKVFGVDSKPEVRDYLYFEQYLNKMYEVDAVAESDDVLYSGSYWRVSLVTYQQRGAVQYPDKNIEDEKDAIVTSLEQFEEERQTEFENVSKPNQYKTIGTLNNDYVRRTLDKKLLISEENVYNQWTVISKYHYDLSSMDEGEETVAYRYDSGWSDSTNRAFTFWIRPQYTTPKGSNILISNFGDSGSGVEFTLESDTSSDSENISKLTVGDYVVVKGTKSYNGIHKIIAKTGDVITLDTSYVDNLTSGTPRIYKEDHATFLVYEDEETGSIPKVSFTYTQSWFIIDLGDYTYSYDLSSQSLTLLKGYWYGFVINMNAVAKQLSLFAYSLLDSTTTSNQGIDADLKKEFEEIKTLVPVTVEDDLRWKLLASPTHLTNIRIWSSPIEIEEQSNVLSQYVVNDTSLALLLDNATPQLRLSRVTNPR